MTAAKKLNTLSVKEYFQPYESFCRAMLDAYAVVDTSGKVIKLNQLLCQLLGLKSKQIMRADSLEDMIQFYINDNPLTLDEIINNIAPTRIDEVRGSTKDSDNLNLLIGVYPFQDEDGNTVGSFVMIRDVTAETNLQGKYHDAQNKSITDPLTGLFTRGYFEDFLRLQSKTMVELPPNADQRVLSLIMLDIDHFKQVNDVHGHQAGDFILKEMSTTMKKSFRKTDIICRYGGEEFLIILPTTNLEGTFAAGDKLRKNVEAEKFIFEGTHIPITVSCGVAQINVGNEEYNETIARADQALYKAKKSGRNKVCKAE